MSDVIERPNTALAPTGGDPFAAYGAKVGTQGQFLSFKNGEFLYGQDDKELPIGTRVAANMAGLRIGWRRWFGGTVTDDLTELLVDQPHIAPRNTLGDMDTAAWETDNQGKPRDPWQLTNVLEFVDAAGETYIYSTASKGGIGAIGRLCKEYGKQYRQRPGMVPIIELGKDSYNHPEYGKTYFPVFTIVDWKTEEELMTGSNDDPAPAPAKQEPAKAAPPVPNSKKPRF